MLRNLRLVCAGGLIAYSVSGLDVSFASHHQVHSVRGPRRASSPSGLRNLLQIG